MAQNYEKGSTLDTARGAIIQIQIELLPRGKEDKTPYVATVRGDGFTYHAQGQTPSEALLLVAAHWHSRAAPVTNG